MNTHDSDSPSVKRARWSEAHSLFYLPFAGGALTGILLRVIFSDEQGGALSAMSCGFVIGAPVIVGAVTILIAEHIQPRTWRFHASAGATSVLLFVLGTMLLHLEGLICAILIAPLLAFAGAVGGLIMGAACRLGRNLWKTMQAIALLPLLLLWSESGTPLPMQVHETTRSIYVDASAAAIWPHLLNVQNIDARQFEDAWAFRIGVPTPLSAVMREMDAPVRHVRMAKQVHFDQVVAEAVVNDHVRWTYRFYDDSFPAGSMDDHVRIGGRYFDLLDSEYSLHPEGGRTKLTVTVHYRLSTRFNWYAGPILEFLMGNAADAYLGLYRSRAETSRT